MSTEILTLITIVVTFIFGIIANKVKWFNNYLIPIQNLTIGIIFAAIQFIITNNFDMAVALSGLLAGGTYDLIKNINLAIQEYQEKKSKEKQV